MVKYGYLAALFVCLNMLLAPLAAAQDGRDLFAESRFVLSTQQGNLPGFMQKKINLKSDDMLLKEILKNLEQKVPVQFAYMESLVAGNKRFTFDLRQIPFHQALSKILEHAGIDYGIFEDGYIILRKQEEIEEQKLQADITGTITDGTTGEGLPGANVSIEGTTRGTSTDAEGQYRITGVEPGTYTLVVTFIGYEENRREVTVGEGQESLTVDFTLQPASMALEEMVVIGYGTQERSEVTGSISSVSSEDINNVSTSNVEEALQGQASGVLITQSSGQPGTSIDVNVRGAAALGDSNPLYVIDGIPVNNEAGGTINPMASLNPNDIESIEILKDASAAAIYGSRAANGVVMITTKRGFSGETRVQVSARGGIRNIPQNRYIDMMNTQQFYEYSTAAYANAGLPIPIAWQEPNLSNNLETNTDWQDEAFSSAVVQNYNINVSGGNENAVYSLNSGYLDEGGNLPDSRFDRGSLRINSEFYIGDDNQLTIGENISLSRSSWAGTVSSNSAVINELLQQSPTVPVHNPDNLGGYAGPTNETSPGFRLNQIGNMDLEEDEYVLQRLLGTAYVEYDILSNLSYRLNLSADISNGFDQIFTPRYNMETNVNTLADLSQTRIENRSIILENTLSYNLVVDDLHEFDLLAGYTQERRDIESLSATAQGFPSDDLRTIDAATGQKTVEGTATASALQSFLGRVEYTYDDRYRAQFAIRRDGSSRFGQERRWGTFPSGSVSWRLKNEDFMSDFEALSQLTLRGSWGITGSQQIPDFAAIPTIEPVANYVIGIDEQLAPGSTILTLGNSELQWQETTQLDVGLDLGFFNDELTFVLDYFKKNTTNLLVRLPVATSSGIRRDNGAFQNVGEVQNTGVEFGASYQKTFNDFSFQLNGNISTINNEVKDVGVDQIIVSVVADANTLTTITRPGSELGAFYGYVMDGIFKDQAEIDNHATQAGAGPGDIKFRDLDGNGTVNSEDRTIIGSPFPDFYYGFGMKLDYKQWGLRVQMDGVQGRDVFNQRGGIDQRGFNNTSAKYMDYWSPENTDAAHPRPIVSDPNQNLRSSTYLVEDGSYLAIRNVTLGYTFNTEALSRVVSLSDLRLFASVTNLGYLTPYTGYNPEVGVAGEGERASLTRSVDQGGYPIARTFEAGIEFGF